MVGGHVREEIQLKYQRTTETVVMVTESVHVMSIDSCVFEDGVEISELEPVPRVSSGLVNMHIFVTRL